MKDTLNFNSAGYKISNSEIRNGVVGRFRSHKILGNIIKWMMSYNNCIYEISHWISFILYYKLNQDVYDFWIALIFEWNNIG